MFKIYTTKYKYAQYTLQNINMYILHDKLWMFTIYTIKYKYVKYTLQIMNVHNIQYKI